MPPATEFYVTWQLDPVLIGGLLAMIVGYSLMIGPLRTRLAPQEPFPVRHAIFFYSGVLLFYWAEGSPLHDLAERYSFMAHMFQHNIVSYAVAPLLLAGTPIWLARILLTGKFIYPITRIVLSPIPAFAIFNLLYAMWHLPIVYEAALRDTTLHHTQHLIFLTMSLIVWWPVLSRVPELPRPAELGQLAYIFLLPVAQMPVFGLITFSDHVLYPSYELAPTWLVGTRLADQAMAGAIMKITGFVSFGIAFIVIFMRWYSKQTGLTFGGAPVRRKPSDQSSNGDNALPPKQEGGSGASVS